MILSLDQIRYYIRKVMRVIARFLNRVTRGKISPNAITIIGLLAHIPIAGLIVTRHDVLAGVLLIIFGLFDTLDGELARIQGKETAQGMLLDAVSDRFKEVLLYSAIGYNLIQIGQPYLAVWAIFACGSSLCVSYVKAKGESAYLSNHYSQTNINHLFRDGFMRFEIRISVLIIGLLTQYLGAAIIIIAILAGYTAISRLINISRKLDVQG